MTPKSTVSLYAQQAATAYVGLLATAAIVWTIASAAGLAPWLVLPQPAGLDVAPLGAIVQVGIALFALALVTMLPTALRVLRLEAAHRSFQITMDDVRHAYMAAHAEDRDGAFRLASEFDAVRERMAFLTRHPELAKLEPEVLEVAAQMSEVSRGLADTYSREKVERARAVLEQRQKEVGDLHERIATARRVTQQLVRYRSEVAADEAVAQRKLDALRADLAGILPELEAPGTVTPKKPVRKSAPRTARKKALPSDPAPSTKVVPITSKKKAQGPIPAE
ncbi:MAG: DNA repair protein [Shimia sp.]